MHKLQCRMIGAPFDGYEVNMTYRCIYTNSVYYGVECISLNRQQRKRLNKTWTIPWLHRLHFSQKVNTDIQQMIQEDGGLELFKIEEIIMLKKMNILYSHLRMGDRIGKQILSNVVYAQIYNGLQHSILNIEKNS